MTLQRAFNIAGLTSLAVMLFPQIVLIGLAAGILPGIVLALMPTIFAYCGLWYFGYQLTYFIGTLFPFWAHNKFPDYAPF